VSSAPLRLAPAGACAASATIAPERRFVGYLAHELRTPLATQRALLELALGDPDVDLDTWREIGTDVLHACRQQEQLLEACLVLARGEIEPESREPVDLAEIARAALKAHDLNGLQSVVVLEPARLTGHPGLLGRLVANLVSNAIRHNIARGWINVTTRTESSSAVLSVENAGPLVPPGELPRLFRPFQQLNRDTGSRGGGTGLGLAIVEAIAEAHEGSITARARTCGGLDIRISFPTG
jgi:signal transduction histidine kinase